MSGSRSEAQLDRAGARGGPTGWFGQFGGRFVPEALVPPLLELSAAWRRLRTDRTFDDQLAYLLRDFAGRPTPLYHAGRLSSVVAGTRIYLKREDLNHTGSHKISNCLGQVLVARALGKSRIIAETGAGQHGIAMATVCARFAMHCTVFMGAADVARQALNVHRMATLGAEVVPVVAGSGTLKDAMNAAFRAWSGRAHDTHLAIGSASGPDPYPEMVRHFQRVIGDETRQQVQAREGRLPDMVVAPVGGGSNAIGMFHAFRDDGAVELVGVQAGGNGREPRLSAASIGARRVGILHGCRTMVLQDGDGQIVEARSISAGLDYPAVGPEHAFLASTGRASYVTVSDSEAVDAFRRCSRLEGIVPALESAHAIAHVLSWKQHAGPPRRTRVIVVCLSGRGDKDVQRLLPEPSSQASATAAQHGSFDVV